MRRSLLVAAVLVVAAAVAAVGLAERPALVPLVPTDLTITGDLVLDPPTPRAGDTVTVRAVLGADRATRLRGLTVRVRDDLGGAADFPVLEQVDLGPDTREFVLERHFPDPGHYTYFLAYRADGDWVALPPWQDFSVRPR